MSDGRREPGEVVALRYVLTDGRVEMCWPCRVVRDDGELLALYVAAGSRYKASPKRTAAEKRARPSPPLPLDEYVWHADTLRLMFPNARHSVWLFWTVGEDGRRFAKYFVNLEEPFRRTEIGFDTQDHTLDVVVQPDLTWAWRDAGELEQHVAHGFFTRALAESVRAEGARVASEIEQGAHVCLEWSRWAPDAGWASPPDVPAGWDTAASEPWALRAWAYGD